MRKIKFIINPAAGNGQAKKTISIIKNKMDMTQIEYSISISGYKGDVEKIALKAVDEFYTDIIAVGGDGTVLEVFNSIYNKNINLGVIPAGTGNDFVKMLNISKNISESVDKVIGGKTKLIDIGIVNNTHFLNVVGLGIDGEIVEKTEKVKKIIKGSSAYIFSTFATLLNFKCKKMKITIDGKVIERECFLVAVGNGKFYGGGMMITPGAEIDNEKFEIIVINKISKLKFTILFKKVFTGKHVYENAVEIFYGKNIHISCESPLKINADGNIIGYGDCNIQIKEKYQKVLC